MRTAHRVLLLLMGWMLSWAQAAPFEMDMVETEDVKVLYLDPVQTYLVPHVSRSFHNSLNFQKKIFDWEPWEKSTVVLTDLADYGNAGAGVSPRNGVTVYIAPSNRTLETLPGSERTFMLMNHELVHVATMDGWNEQDARWRRFFMGKPRQSDEHPESILYNYLTAPRMNAPRWYLEGSAVFLETWMSGGIGRAQGAYDEMVFRSMVRDDAHFYSNLGIVSEGVSVDFQVGVNAYLYGTRFISYLAYEYSPEQLIEWLGRNAESKRYYSTQFETVYGLPLEEAWNDWIAFEKKFQNANLERVREKPLTPTEPLVPQALGSISRSFLTPDGSKLLGAFRYPGVVAHVGTLDLESGNMQRLSDVKGPKAYAVTSSAYDAKRNTFYFTADNNAYRDIMSVDVETGETRMLMEDARIGDLAFNAADDSIWGLRHLNGYVSLVRIPAPYIDFNELYTWPYGQVAYELDVSHNGEMLSLSKAEIDGTQHLQVYRTADLLERHVEPIKQYDFGPSIPEGFVFSKDDNYLYGTSFITGVSNVLRFDLDTSELVAVSNAETGFFRPLPMNNGSLIVFEYTGQGFLPTRIDPVPLQDLSAITFLGNETVKKHPVLKDYSVIPSLREVNHDDLVTGKRKYRPAREIELGSIYPVIEGYRDDVAVGWHFNFADPANFHRIESTISHTVAGDLPSSEDLHFNIKYSTLNWDLRYWHNDADFYDLFGPTKYARRGDAFMVGYEKALIYDEPKKLTLNLNLDYFTGLDTLPSNQNVATVSFEDILSAEASLSFENTRKSLGAVDHEKGYAWDLSLQTYDVEGDTVKKLSGGFDLGFPLDWKHSSVWLYSSFGVSDGNSNNPLTSYYFGSFGNNYVDNRDEKRYRTHFSMPGFEIDEIPAKSFGKAMLEWNLPPLRFREAGTPGLFLSWVRPAVFAGTLWARPVKGSQRRVNSLGLQLDLNFTLIHRLPMTLSAGFAAGFESGEPTEREWMISLKVL